MASLQEQLAGLQQQTTVKPTQVDDLRRLIAQITGVDAESISGDSLLADDLGIDSISLIELAVRCEQTFRVKSDAEAYLSMRTFSDLERYLAH